MLLIRLQLGEMSFVEIDRLQESTFLTFKLLFNNNRSCHCPCWRKPPQLNESRRADVRKNIKWRCPEHEQSLQSEARIQASLTDVWIAKEHHCRWRERTEWAEIIVSFRNHARYFLVFVECRTDKYSYLYSPSRNEYRPEGVGTSCSISWQARTANVISYNTMMFIFAYTIPLVVMVYCNVCIYQKVNVAVSSADGFT